MSVVDMDLQCMSWQPYMSGQIMSKRRTATLESCKQILGCSLQVFPPDGPMFVSVTDLQSTSPLALLEPRTLGGNLLHHIFALV